MPPNRGKPAHLTTAARSGLLLATALASTALAAGEPTADEAADPGAAPVPGAPAAAPPPAAALAPAPSGPPGDAPALTATAPWRSARGESWDAWGEGRLRLLGAATLGTDETGALLSQQRWLASRVLAGGRWAPSPTLRLDVELEVLSGYLAGDVNALGTQYTPRPFPQAQDGRDRFRLVPRKANVAVTTPVGQVVLGAQAFHWGTGMLVNDGAGLAQLDGLQFGDAWLGNVVGRAALLTRPFAPLAVFAALDLVLRDDNASLYDGDLAASAVLGARLERDAFAAGLLVSGRHQVDRADPFRPGAAASATTVAVTDAFARGALGLGKGRRLAAEGEVALVAGHTTRPLTTATAATGAAVLQLGGTARLRFDDEGTGLTAALEAGYASGDNDPADDVARTFTMHTDHNVGLVLFERVLPALTARGVDRLADPSLAGTPPASARFLVNPGAVQGAAYLHPVVKWRPLPALDLRLGYVYALSSAALFDAYRSGLSGGAPVAPAGSALGHELDARATWTQPLPASLRLLLGVEGGVLFPGPALARVQALGTPWVARGLVSLRW